MKRGNDSRPGWVANMGMLIFGLIFTLSGLWAGVLPLGQALHGWWRTQFFVAVPADVLQVALKTHQGESTTYQALAEFGYEFKGVHYRSTRINTLDGSDNLDDYHQEQVGRLQQAKQQERKVTLWLDPQDPGYALFDPHPRWKKIVFLLPFALLFPAVGLGLWWWQWRKWRGAGNPANPATPLPVAAAARVIAPEASGFLIGILFAGFWNLIAWPLAITFLSKKSIADNPTVLLAALFPAIGLLMVWAMCKALLVRRRMGKPLLWLSRPPQTGTGAIAAQIRFAPPLGTQAIWHKPHYDIKLEIRCTHSDTSGDNNSHKVLWSNTMARPHQPHGTTAIDFALDLPANQPPSGELEKEDNTIVWQLALMAFGGELTFVLPVSAG